MGKDHNGSEGIGEDLQYDGGDRSGSHTFYGLYRRLRGTIPQKSGFSERLKMTALSADYLQVGILTKEEFTLINMFKECQMAIKDEKQWG